MKAYTLRKWNLETIERQNNADIIDCIEGCLLDNLLYVTKRGFLALIETYANANSSIYTLYFTKDEDEMIELWDKCKVE